MVVSEGFAQSPALNCRANHFESAVVNRDIDCRVVNILLFLVLWGGMVHLEC